jgi:hypothetical protein
MGNAGGAAGAGGAGGGNTNRPFPTFGILDNFNRLGPSLGLNWVGETSEYRVADQSLQCEAGYCPATFWHQAFGPTQEVFAKLVGFSESAPEINLVLAAQGGPDCDLIEVLYSPNDPRVLIEACWDGSWNRFGVVDVAFQRGDQLGGRLKMDGFIDVFKNGMLVGTVDANDYPYIGMSGRIGVNGVSQVGVPDAWDDFGGGGG